MSNKTDTRKFSGYGVSKLIDTVGGTNTHTDNWTLAVYATGGNDYIWVKAKPKDFTDWNFSDKNDADMLERVYIDLAAGNDYYNSKPIQGEWATNDFREIVNGGYGNDEIHTADLEHGAGAKIYGGDGDDKIYGTRQDDYVGGDAKVTEYVGGDNYVTSIQAEESGRS